MYRENIDEEIVVARIYPSILIILTLISINILGLSHIGNDEMKYHIEDDSGNCYNYSQIQNAVKTRDPPVFLGDATDMDKCVAGELFTVSAKFSDDFDSRNLTAWVNYSISRGPWLADSLIYTTGYYYNLTMEIPDDATSFLYYFMAEDLDGNILDTYVAMDIANKIDNPPVVIDNTKPTAYVERNITVDQGDTVTFNATLSSDNVGIVNYTWTFTYDGVEQELYGVTVNFTFDIAGEYLVWLNTTDAQDNWHAINFTVFVLDIEAPVSDPGLNQTGDQGDKIVFNATDSTDNVGIVNYTWTIDDETLYGMEVNYTFEDAGVYLVVLKVKDAAGNFHEANITVTIEDITPPVALGGAVNMGTKYFFNGTFSSDNVGVDNYTWTFYYGGIKTLYGAGPKYTFANPGEYNVTLTVKDVAGNTAKDYFIVTVEDTEAPTIKVSIGGTDIVTGHQEIITEGGKLTFDASGSSDNAAGTLTYSWYIDGETKTEADFEHQFDNVGTVTVTLTVTDAADNEETFTFDVKVTKEVPPEPPTEDDGLSTGAIVGIVVGVIIILILIILFLVMMAFKKKPEEDLYEEKAGEFKCPGCGGLVSVDWDSCPECGEDLVLLEENAESEGDMKAEGEIELEEELPDEPERSEVFGGEEEEGEALVEEAVEEKIEWQLDLFKSKLTPTEKRTVKSAMKMIIPNYFISHKIGSGGYASIYKATRPDGKEVALKIPKSQDIFETLDDSIIKKFTNEANLWKKLQHNKIVKFYESNTTPLPYISMENFEKHRI